MNTYADKTQENKSMSVANEVAQKQSGGETAFQFADNQPEAIAQRKQQEMANNSPRVKKLSAIQKMANNSPQAKQTAQLQAIADNYSARKQHPIQKKENKTGLPDNLKSGIENLSGYSMDDMKVHYNSEKPAQLQAHAYAQRTDIHLGSGQEKHLPHEAWHVVQQKQGRVKPTMQMKGKVNVNDDKGLEQEADVMGARALNQADVAQKKNTDTENALAEVNNQAVQRQVIQLYSPVGGETRYSTNHRFMLLNSKSLWTHQEDLDYSNQVLDTKNSFVRLVRTGLSFESAFGGTMYEIAPEWNTDRDTTIPETQRLAAANQEVDGYTTHADCFMNAQTVMGVEDTATGSRDSVAPIFEHGGERSQMAPIGADTIHAGPASVISGNAPTRGYLAFIEHALPAFYTTLDEKGEDRTQTESNFLANCRRESRNGMLYAYRQLSGDAQYATVLDTFSRQFGVNEYMSPEIGEGLAVINEPYERQAMQNRIESGEAEQDDELWNYHFAGVVMKDGDDYVTLENYSVGNDQVDNQNWILQMYGTGDQSFHAEMKGKDGIGNSALSLGFTTRA